MQTDHERPIVAYLYENEEGSRELVFDCNSEYARRLIEFGYTETPLTALTADKARGEALEEARRLEDENRDLRREQIALVEAAGGEIKVPHEVLNDLPSLELIKCRFPEDMTVRYETRSLKGAAK